jgi:autotransporter family porin
MAMQVEAGQPTNDTYDTPAQERHSAVLTPRVAYRPEIGAYLGNQHAAATMFIHTLHDRVGEVNVAERRHQEESEGEAAAFGATWVRIKGDQFDTSVDGGQADIGTSTALVQVGGDVVRWTAGEHRFQVGLMGGWGRANTLADSASTPQQTLGVAEGYSVGAYGTWLASTNEANGAYMDGWLQYGRYGNTVRGRRHSARTLTGSLEAGYAIRVRQGDSSSLYVEPQIQALYADHSAQTPLLANGVVIGRQEAGGLIARLAARLYGHTPVTGANRVQPFLQLNWWHAKETEALTVDGERLDWRQPADVYEAQLGVQAELGGSWSGWGQLGLSDGAGAYRNVGALVGLMRRW